MNGRIISMICVLIMMTTGLLTCISVSADSTDIPTDTSITDQTGFALHPLTQHACDGTSNQYTYGDYTFWSTDYYYNANFGDRYEGFWIYDLTYSSGGTSHPMIANAYQTGILYKSSNGNWYHLYMKDYTSCITNVYTDTYGWHQYAQYSWGVTQSGTLYYLADFGIESGHVHFGAYLWWKQNGQTYGVTEMIGWWHIEFQVGTATNIPYQASSGWTQITTASMNTPSSWSEMKYVETGHSGHYMETTGNSYGTNIAGGSVVQDWAAVNSPYSDYLSLPNCANGNTLNTAPWGAEYAHVTSLPASDTTLHRAYDWTEWYGNWV